MKKRYRTVIAIEYAFVVSVMASFTVLGVAGLLFGISNQSVDRVARWLSRTDCHGCGSCRGICRFAHRTKSETDEPKEPWSQRPVDQALRF